MSTAATKRLWVLALEASGIPQADMSRSIVKLMRIFNTGEEQLNNYNLELESATIADKRKAAIVLELNGNGIKGDENETGLIQDLEVLDAELEKKILDYAKHYDKYKKSGQRLQDGKKNKTQSKNTDKTPPVTAPVKDPATPDPSEPDPVLSNPVPNDDPPSPDGANAVPPVDPAVASDTPPVPNDDTPADAVVAVADDADKKGNTGTIILGVASVVLAIFGLSKLVKAFSKKE